MSFGSWPPILCPRYIDPLFHIHTLSTQLLFVFISQFTKTPRFLALRSQNDDFDFLDNDVQYLSSTGPTVPPGLDSGQEVGGAYVTVSQKGAVAAHESRPRTAAGGGGGDREAGRRAWNDS